VGIDGGVPTEDLRIAWWDWIDKQKKKEFGLWKKFYSYVCQVETWDDM